MMQQPIDPNLPNAHLLKRPSALKRIGGGIAKGAAVGAMIGLGIPFVIGAATFVGVAVFTLFNFTAAFGFGAFAFGAAAGNMFVPLAIAGAGLGGIAETVSTLFNRKRTNGTLAPPKPLLSGKAKNQQQIQPTVPESLSTELERATEAGGVHGKHSEAVLAGRAGQQTQQSVTTRV